MPKGQFTSADIDISAKPAGQFTAADIDNPKEPGFFEPHQESDWTSRAKEFGRGALANTIGAVMHPLDTLEGMGKSAMASGMAPGGQYPAIGFTGNKTRDLGNIERKESGQSQMVQQGGQMIREHPAYLAGSIAGSAIVGKAVGTESEMTPTEAITAPIRGAAKSANAVLSKAPAIGKAAGLLIGAKGIATMNPWEALAGPRYGAKFGELLGNMKVPGERFGLPEEPTLRAIYPDEDPSYASQYQTSSLPGIGPQRTTPAGLPKGVGEGKVSQPPAIKMGEGKRTIYPGSSDAAAIEKPQVAAPSEAQPTPNEVAVGMGFKNATQAMGRLGPQVWQETYNKIIASPESSAKPTVAAPTQAAPTSEFPPVDFKNRQNLTSENPAASWRDTQEDLAIRDRMERQYGTDTAPVTKDVYIRKTDNAEVPHEWALQHPGEFYVTESPYEFAPTIEGYGMQAGQRQIPRSRQGRAVASEVGRVRAANESADIAKNVLGRRSK